MPVDYEYLNDFITQYADAVIAVVQAAETASETRIKALACISTTAIDELLEQNKTAQEHLTDTLAALPQSSPPEALRCRPLLHKTVEHDDCWCAPAAGAGQ